MAVSARFVALGLLVVALAAAPAAGKTISISISATAQVRDGALAMTIEVRNSGDDTAQAVSPVLRFGTQEVRGKGRETLGPGESMSEELSVPAPSVGPGRWPYRLAVDYTDTNSYPFQAMHVATVTVGSPPPAKVAVPDMKAPPLAGTGTLEVTVKNLAGVERSAVLSVWAPEGLEVAKQPGEVALAAWEEQKVSVPLVNRTALPGSRYPVFVAAEYDDQDTHQALVSQGIVEVIAVSSVLSTQRRLLWIGAGVLVVMWIGLVAWWLVRRRPRGLPA